MIRGVLFLLITPFFTYAESIEVEYASFYSHVKKLENDDTQALRFAFGFQNITESRLCKINSAKIVTQKQVLPLIVEPNRRFTVPSDKILKMAKALVEIDIDDQANQCDMSVQLETTPEYLKDSYTKQELIFLLEQYRSFFDDMGGFLSFMMPEVDGLVFNFDSEVEFLGSKIALAKGNSLTLTIEKIEKLPSLTLPVKPLRITASLEK